MGRRPRSNRIEYQMVSALDRLAEFESFEEEVLPILRKAIKDGWSAERIENDPKLKALMVARQMTIALREKDSSKALAAIKDTRDRREGKAKERLEIENKYAKLKDEELDALLASELTDLDTDPDEAH